ncbi:MAG TPA: CoA transferase [Dehalococcoidia bacterium]|nr:CoA transferase [Dehalococcoidia bacterium]
MQEKMGMALEGIKVIDCSQVAAVPMAARMLGDFGADVIHIENPTTGDYWRVFKDVQAEQSAACPSDFDYNWENYNRNKRSLTLDLSRDNGRAIIHRMVQEADVFLSNLRSFELERFQVDYQTLEKINPRIIWGNVNGYGKAGPDKDLPAYDATAYWARAGFPYIMSQPGIPSFGYRPAIGDNVVGMSLAFGIMQALYVREKTGIGQEVSVSLLHTGIFQNGFDISGALVTGLDPADWREQPPAELVQQSMTAIAQVMAFYGAKAKSPLTGLYMTKDARALIFIILQPDRYWVKFCKAVGREDLSNNPSYNTIEGRAENITELRAIFSEIFITKTYEEWHPLLEGIPYAPNQSLREVINDPQARASGCFVSYDHPQCGRIEQIANPIMMSKTPSSVRLPAPEFGQHTEEVLLEHGYTWEDIVGFKEDGSIA